MKKKVILTGDRPTGKLHIGHYVGSLRERVKMQESGEYDPFIMIADQQALTDNARDPEKIRRSLTKVASTTWRWAWTRPSRPSSCNPRFRPWPN